MNKLFRVVRSVHIEEYILLISTICLLISVGIFFDAKQQITGQENFFGLIESFNYGYRVVAGGLEYFMAVIAAFGLFYIFQFYVYIVKTIHPYLQTGQPLIGLIKKIDIGRIGQRIKVKNGLVRIFIFIRPFISAIIFFSFVNVLVGSLSVFLRGNLYDGQLMVFDNWIFGFMPFLGSVYQVGILLKLISAMIFSYSALGIAIAVGWIWTYLKNRKYFSQFIIAMALSVMVSLPFWIIFPANSPRHLNNLYLPNEINQNYNHDIDQQIEFLLAQNSLNSQVAIFHQSLNINRDDNPPISTIPSMHIVWAIVIFYYLYKCSKKTIFFTLPWTFFSSLGAVYLGQHYFADILASIPAALIVILLSNLIVRVEKRYYISNRLDIIERGIKKRLISDLKQIPKFFKYLYSLVVSS